MVFAADKSKRYEVRVVATDSFEAIGSAVRDLPAAYAVLHYAKHLLSMGIGRLCDKANALQVGLKAYFDEDVEVSGGLTSNTIKATSLLQIAGSSVMDFVVEQGTSDIWTYRKWSSGRSECWANKNCGDISVTSAWGTLFEGSNIGGISYPSGLFVSQPIFFPSVQTTKYGICGIEIDGGNATTTPNLYLLRATAQTVQGVYLSMYANGRWK